MNISLDLIKILRQRTGIGVMEAKQALQSNDGDIEKAIKSLRLRGEKISLKKEGRITKQGLVEAYIHSNQRVGSLVVLLCETDFVARTSIFKSLAHDIALHIVASNPLYITPDDVPTEVANEEKSMYRQQLDGSKPVEIQEKVISGKFDKYLQEKCLLRQKFVRDDTMTIEDLLKQKIGELGENIKIQHFSRFEI